MALEKESCPVLGNLYLTESRLSVPPTVALAESLLYSAGTVSGIPQFLVDGSGL